MAGNGAEANGCQSSGGERLEDAPAVGPSPDLAGEPIKTLWVHGHESFVRVILARLSFVIHAPCWQQVRHQTRVRISADANAVTRLETYSFRDMSSATETLPRRYDTQHSCQSFGRTRNLGQVSGLPNRNAGESHPAFMDS
ncbi:MAG: hypothetical protein KC432_10680 [Thermomicrobiales bacterium]|nr:hypothetical protein [Thermomicrobiales bacterium]